MNNILKYFLKKNLNLKFFIIYLSLFTNSYGQSTGKCASYMLINEGLRTVNYVKMECMLYSQNGEFTTVGHLYTAQGSSFRVEVKTKGNNSRVKIGASGSDWLSPSGASAKIQGNNGDIMIRFDRPVRFSGNKVINPGSYISISGRFTPSNM